MVNRTKQVQGVLYGKPFRRHAFYLLIFFLACMTVYDVTHLTLEYAENPTQTQMSMTFNESMTYPNMTFCMSKRQAWSHFGVNVNDRTQMDKVEQWGKGIETALHNLTDRESFLKESWPPELVMNAYAAISTLNLLERESVAQQAIKDIKQFANSTKMAKYRTLVNNWLHAINERNVSFSEFMYKTGIETLKRSMRRFQRVAVEDDEAQFNMTTKISWISSKHFCFQPIFKDENSFRPITEQGDFFVLTVFHDIKTLSDKPGECMSLDFHGRPTTMARNMEGKGRVKDGTTEELCLGMVHEVKVEIRAQYTMLENDEKTTACRNYDVDSDEKGVSEFDCRSRCRMEMIRQMCHCTPLTLAYLSDDKELEKNPPCEYEKCDLKDNLNYTDQLCAKRCFPDCVQIRFTVAADQKGRAVNAQITMVTLIWGAFEYLALEQSYKFSLWTFIAAVGGSIGIWLGLSVLSLIQLITFLTERTAVKVKEKAKKDKHNHHHKTHPAANGSGANPYKYSQESKERERKMSQNPFGGPVGINPFESPFPKNQGPNGAKSGGHQGGGAGANETAFHNRAASP